VLARDGTDASPLLGRLLEELGPVFEKEVLKKWLSPTDVALLARACWKCGEAAGEYTRPLLSSTEPSWPLKPPNLPTNHTEIAHDKPESGRVSARP